MSAPTATFTVRGSEVAVRLAGREVTRAGMTVFLAVADGTSGGCSVVPYRHGWEGSTLFLPRAVTRLYAAQVRADGVQMWRRGWSGAGWTEPTELAGEGRALIADGELQMRIDLEGTGLSAWAEGFQRGGASPPLIWAKDMARNDGWGAVVPHGGGPLAPIAGDFVLPEPGWTEDAEMSGCFQLSWRKPAAARPRIYQLFPRLFGNTNERRKPNGSAAENGVGKFADITSTALRALREELHVTHVWLTGVLAHATGTAFPEIGRAADDPDLLKGIAGSPYAIRDYGDVAPDLAVDPARRLEEFKTLVQRVRDAGLAAIIDFVPNHVARNHQSRVVEFGRLDDTSRFFLPSNNFFWLQPDSPGGGPPLRLPTVENGNAISPTCQVLGGCDGRHETELDRGRVTGNNAATWAPSAWDWYETAKLNYGYDFTTGNRAYPNTENPAAAVPDTWKKMDAVLSYWQGLGIDGFRCDMAHMVPPEFWQWAVARARERSPTVFFIAEAYNDDPMKVEGGDPLLRGFGSVTIELLNAGFNAVYDAAAYKALHRIYDGSAWANDLDAALGVRDGRIAPDYAFHRGLRYAENHDEVRLAGRGQWGGIGMNVGRPVSAILYALSRGAILLHNGQEVGEPADGAEGYGGDDARSTIFDYWSMPEMCKWVNGHRYDGGRLSAEQRDLRAFYGRLLALIDELPFREGEFAPLNPHNLWNAAFGRLNDEGASGHWLYAFLRFHVASGEAFLVAVNLHRASSLTNVRINLPGWSETFPFAGVDGALRDELSGVEAPRVCAGGNAVEISTLPALTPGFFRLRLRGPSN